MAIYEYQCPKCGDITEVMHKIDESIAILCGKHSSTEQVQMTKIISSGGFILKGTGWTNKFYPK